MLKKAVLIFIFCFAMGFPVSAVDISAKAAAVVEQSTGRLIYGKNENARLSMASTTKIMTGLLAVESGRLGEIITVSADAIQVEGSSMGLVADEKISLLDITYGLMLNSGNDAANTIAISLGGSIDSFVELMNNRAAQLGLANTHFSTPSGLDAKDHYTSAYDLAKLGAYAMNNEVFAKIVSTQKIKISYNGVKYGRVLINHNRLLKSYEGAVGIKTGFTKKSGRCLVSCAVKDGVCIVVCTLDDPNDWSDHKKLLDMGFSTLESATVLANPLTLTENVVGGVSDTVQVESGSNVKATLKDGEASEVSMQVELPKFVYAPVKKGETLGRLVFRLNGTVVANADLKACGDVVFKSIGQKNSSLWSKILSFFYNLFT